MATWFELRIDTTDADYAAQAAQEAFARIDRLESLLSRYREDSEVRQLGRLDPGEAMRLHPDTFACLRQSLELAEATGGAFDPALGLIAIACSRPRVRCACLHGHARRACAASALLGRPCLHITRSRSRHGDDARPSRVSRPRPAPVRLAAARVDHPGVFLVRRVLHPPLVEIAPRARYQHVDAHRHGHGSCVFLFTGGCAVWRNLPRLTAHRTPRRAALLRRGRIHHDHRFARPNS